MCLSCLDNSSCCWNTADVLPKQNTQMPLKYQSILYMPGHCLITVRYIIAMYSYIYVQPTGVEMLLGKINARHTIHS